MSESQNHPAIIANIAGGLGNQMFQYACALSLSLEWDLPLKVSQDMFRIYPSSRGPELERVFSLTLQAVGPDELRKTLGPLRHSPSVRRALTSKVLAPLRGSRFILEPHFPFWEGLRNRAKAGGYLQGYWQSERYFEKHAPAVRKAFTFREPLSGQNAETQRDILQSQSVSVHIRRGDYVSNPKASSKHGICQPEYYLQAINRLSGQLPGARFFVFSDDLEWVRKVLSPLFPKIILVGQNEGNRSHHDMRLMSLCRHHIIANSSFSWWGAWLNPSPDKKVIAPANWFLDGTDSRDLIPSGWERL